MNWYIWGMIGCSDIQSTIMANVPLQYSAPEAQESVSTVLRPELIASGVFQVTDVQFFSGADHSLKGLVVQKTGEIFLLDMALPIEKRLSLLATIPVKSQSEQGLLGIAIDKNFAQTKKIYCHYTPTDGEDRTEVAVYKLDVTHKTLQKLSTLLTVSQPYPNHNGGQIAIGTDGHLYIALGDGGWRYDPENNGQNPSTLLGSIVRLNIGDPSDINKLIPIDNPFANKDGFDARVWATGLRNPWRFSFLDDGRIIVADVGQNAWEEISIVEKGDNLGWDIWEGSHCVEENCSRQDSTGKAYRMPIYEYGHDVGQSITGGYVVRDGSIRSGQYIFGDFVTGRIWSLSGLDNKATPEQKVTVEEVYQSGWNISTFAQDATGVVYAVDFSGGAIYQLHWL